MNKRFFIIAVLLPALMALAAFSSCRRLDELEKRVSSVESRVQALENQIKALNKNIKAVEALMQAGTINSVSEKAGVYTIVLSNGEKLTLNQGSVGVANAPIMSVDAEGYWMVDYQDGNGKSYIMKGSEKVKALGKDGNTPMFGVDADGHWTVSYDGGAIYSKVKGSDGNPVSALPSGEIKDPYFNEVSYDESTGVFTLVLKDGTSLTLPVVASFLCSIEGAGDVQTFAYLETKTFNVVMNGVAKTLVMAPDGWKASLNENILSVTAPAKTKAVLADSREDVSLIAFSSSGHAAVAKLKVRISDSPIVDNPVAALSLGEVTASSIAFSVVLSDADSWKYKTLKSSEPAPSVDEVNSSGVVGTGLSALVESLEAGTAYTIYVLPLKGTKPGALASVSAATSEAVITDFYQAYSDGKDIVIAGVSYNKSQYGEPVLLTASAADTDLRPSIHHKEGVVFLEQNDGCDFAVSSVSEIEKDVIILSRHADKKATVKPAKFIKLKAGSLVMKNIKLDLTAINGGENAKYLFNNANSTEHFKRLHFEGCDIINIQKPVLYANVPGFGFKSLVADKCRFQMTAAGQIFNFYKSTVLHEYKELIFRNNVVYSSSPVSTQIVNYAQATAQAGSSWDLILSIEDNIFYNVPSKNGYFKFYKVKTLSFKKNLLWADSSSAEDSYCFILYGAGQDAAALSIADNIGYGSAKPWKLAHSTSTAKPDPNEIPKAGEDPFESPVSAEGAYVLKPAYSSYGPAL